MLYQRLPRAALLRRQRQLLLVEPVLLSLRLGEQEEREQVASLESRQEVQQRQPNAVLRQIRSYAEELVALQQRRRAGGQLRDQRAVCWRLQA